MSRLASSRQRSPSGTYCANLPRNLNWKCRPKSSWASNRNWPKESSLILRGHCAQVTHCPTPPEWRWTSPISQWSSVTSALGIVICTWNEAQPAHAILMLTVSRGLGMIYTTRIDYVGKPHQTLCFNRFRRPNDWLWFRRDQPYQYASITERRWAMLPSASQHGVDAQASQAQPAFTDTHPKRLASSCSCALTLPRCRPAVD